MARKRKAAQQPPRDDAKLIAIIAGALAVGASAQATANALSPQIGIPAGMIKTVLLLSLFPASVPPPAVASLPSATATGETSKLEPSFRANYILQASRRLNEAVNSGVPRRVAIDREKQFFAQHRRASSNRRAAAIRVDRAASRYGSTLGWYAVLDNRTSPECRAANGKNFDVNRIPAIGYPGAVHPNCRCKPGKAHATRQTVYSIMPERRAA